MTSHLAIRFLRKHACQLTIAQRATPPLFTGSISTRCFGTFNRSSLVMEQVSFNASVMAQVIIEVSKL